MALFQLGEEITFETKTIVPQQVTVRKDWRWAVQERLQRGPARQKIGTGDKIISFRGVVFPGLMFGGTPVGAGHIKKIEEVAEKMEPLILNDGMGEIYGRFCILDLEEEKDVFMPKGTPRQQTFTFTLGEYFEDEFGIGGGVSTITGQSLA